MADNKSSAALLAIAKIVEELQNDSTDEQFNKKAQDEFSDIADRLRKNCDVLQTQRFAEDTTQLKEASAKVKAVADYVKENREKLDQIAQNFKEVGKLLEIVDDALTIAAAFKP
ncbi:MAG TPA: hypothetical protein V6C86_26635 [Oculatellaceae cyanobacterium]